MESLPENQTNLSVRPFSRDTGSALRLLIRFLQHELGNSLDNLKKRVRDAHNVSKSKFDLFMKAEPRADSAEIYERLAEEFAPDFAALSNPPQPVRVLFDLVYSNLGTGSPTPLNDDAVPAFRSLLHDDASTRGRFLPKLEGLSLLIRRSTEFVSETPETGAPRSEGYSISLLNVLPRHVGMGRHHPLFKLKQRGTQASRVVDINGAVIFQDDRFVLSGRESREQRGFQANVHFAEEQFEKYRETSDPLAGVMLGVSHARSGLGALFQLYAVPGGTLSAEEAEDPQAKQAFEELLSSIGDKIGVVNKETLLERLLEVGLLDVEAHVDDMDLTARTSLVFQYG